MIYGARRGDASDLKFPRREVTAVVSLAPRCRNRPSQCATPPASGPRDGSSCQCCLPVSAHFAPRIRVLVHFGFASRRITVIALLRSFGDTDMTRQVIFKVPLGRCLPSRPGTDD
jgi:hypothetical protein